MTDTRRDFLRKTAAGVGAASALTPESGEAQDFSPSDLFQPEEYWKDRIKAPDDGKKFGWFVL